EEKAGSQEETAKGRSRGVETNLPLPAHCGYLSRVVPDEYARARGCSSRDEGVTSEFFRRRTAAVGGGQSPRGKAPGEPALPAGEGVLGRAGLHRARRGGRVRSGRLPGRGRGGGRAQGVDEPIPHPAGAQSEGHHGPGVPSRSHAEGTSP